MCDTTNKDNVSGAVFYNVYFITTISLEYVLYNNMGDWWHLHEKRISEIKTGTFLANRIPVRKFHGLVVIRIDIRDSETWE